jgi:hypothetical protein
MFGGAMNQIILPSWLPFAIAVPHLSFNATIASTEGTDEHRVSQH